jgi:hypothetical protein
VSHTSGTRLCSCPRRIYRSWWVTSPDSRVQILVSLVAAPASLRHESLSCLQGALRRPLEPVESIPTALRTHLLLAAEACTTGLALVWVRAVRVSAHDCRFHTAQSAHCEFFPRWVLPVHELKVFSLCSVESPEGEGMIPAIPGFWCLLAISGQESRNLQHQNQSSQTLTSSCSRCTMI